MLFWTTVPQRTLITIIIIIIIIIIYIYIYIHTNALRDCAPRLPASPNGSPIILLYIDDSFQVILSMVAYAYKVAYAYEVAYAYKVVLGRLID